MSHEIVYDRQFIKAHTGNSEVYFPIILMGSNNCTETNMFTGRERRERDWKNIKFILDGKQFGTLDQMLAKAQSERDERLTQEGYQDSAFGSYTCLKMHSNSGSFNAYKAFWKNGVRDALTVEELRQHHIDVVVFTGYHFEEKLQAKGIEKIHKTVKTSDELISEVLRIQELLGDMSHALYVSIEASERQMKQLRRHYRPREKSQTKIVEVDFFFALKSSDEGYGYYAKGLRNGRIRTYGEPTVAKTFLTEKEAEAFRKRLSWPSKWVVKKIEKRSRIRVIVKKGEAVTA